MKKFVPVFFLIVFCIAYGLSPVVLGVAYQQIMRLYNELNYEAKKFSYVANTHL